MSSLFDAQERLQGLEATIAKAERAVASNPSSKALTLSMRSLLKRRARLEREFHDAAHALGVDVLSYRVFISDAERPPAAAVTNAISDFQELFSVVYQAIRDQRPKKTKRVDAETLEQSEFGLAYTFSGSVGVVLTLSNDRLLFDEITTHLDDTIRAIASMSRAETPEELVEFSRRLGIGPVRALYDWAHHHVQSRSGADIEWRRGESVRTTVLVQQPQLARLEQILRAASETEQREIEFTGYLMAADPTQKTFRLADADLSIRGTFSDAINAEHQVTLPRRYWARILRSTKIYYSTEREDIDYFLLELRPDDEELPSEEPPST